jgi:hypothetical protein
MYVAKYANMISSDFWDIGFGDWMFNIYYSQFGDIGHVKEHMSVYRVHRKGRWSSKSLQEQARQISARINVYNHYLNYEYNHEFSLAQAKWAIRISDIEQTEKTWGKMISDIRLLFFRVFKTIVQSNSFINEIYIRAHKLWKAWQLKRHLELLRSSNLFDEAWYLANNPDIAVSGVDPMTHYLATGWKEGRDPGPKFYTAWYLDSYDDVKQAGINPLVHYLKFGKQEGRRASPD